MPEPAVSHAPTAPAGGPEAALAEGLGQLEFLLLKVRLRAQTAGPLGEAVGPALHSALGQALRQVVCTTGLPSCPGCPQVASCVFPPLFVPDAVGHARGDGVAFGGSPPARLALRISDRPALLSPGDPLEFGLVLMGRPPYPWPTLQLALFTAVAGGLGGDRVRFGVERIAAVRPGSEEELVWSPGSADRPLTLPAPLTVNDLPPIVPADLLTVAFKTPVRLLKKGRLLARPTFDDLARALLRRVTALLATHCVTDLDPQVADLLRQTPEIETTQFSLVVVKGTRWSARQAREHPLDGVVGQVRFRGEALRAFEPLIRIGEILQVGKGTSFGLGRYEVER